VTVLEVLILSTTCVKFVFTQRNVQTYIWLQLMSALLLTLESLIEKESSMKAINVVIKYSMGMVKFGCKGIIHKLRR